MGKQRYYVAMGQLYGPGLTPDKVEHFQTLLVEAAELAGVYTSVVFLESDRAGKPKRAKRAARKGGKKAVRHG